MNAIASYENYCVDRTSAAGCMLSPSTAVPVAVFSLMLAMNLSGQATASTYNCYPAPELTSATPLFQADPVSSESTATAILEIRRISGLTWDELADLFEVSRRSVHHWASGKHVTAEHEQAIRGIVAAVRHLDRGEAAATRAALLSADTEGQSVFDLLKNGWYEEAASGTVPRTGAARPTRPLSAEAREARRVPHPTSLLMAKQDRPPVPTKARVARAMRVPKPAR